MKLTVVAFESCMSSGVFGLLDAFGVATRFADDKSPWKKLEICLATTTGKPVRSFGGHRIHPDCSIADALDSDIVLVPAIVGDLVAVLDSERALVQWLRNLRPKTTLASACTGAFFLAEASALDNRCVTTNPYYSDLFRKRYPRVRLQLERRIAADHNVICAGSTTAVLDLAVYIVDRFAGHDLAVTTAKVLSMSKNTESQLPYVLFNAPREHGDDKVSESQSWIEEHYRSDVTANRVASKVSVSVRTLNRRFLVATGMQPMRYLRLVRVDAAKRLLEDPRNSVERVASRVGYRDARAFVRAFATESGVSPAGYRRKFHR